MYNNYYGGSWISVPLAAEHARSFNKPTIKTFDIGFRLIKKLKI